MAEKMLEKRTQKTAENGSSKKSDHNTDGGMDKPTENSTQKKYTILIPMMAPIHFAFLRNVFRSYGHDVQILTNIGPSVADEGLRHVHNDTCYPALLVIGQMIDALKSGAYDLSRTALMITQTGGGCRASNYIHLLRKALKKAGMGHVPVLSLNLSGLEKESGFKLTLPMLLKLFYALVYGDLLMLLHNQVRPYEIEKGDSQRIVDRWVDTISRHFEAGHGLNLRELERELKAITEAFAAIPTNKTPKVKVGIVGEIYVKYSALGNNNLEDFLDMEGCEIMVPGLMGFMLFKTDNRLEDIRLYGGNPFKYFVVSLLMGYMRKLENRIIRVVEQNGTFTAPSPYAHVRHLVKGIVGYGNKMGEGWLLTGEMMELAEKGYGNIVCTQPFGCLPNHITGKGMIRKIRTVFPDVNIVPIDYDPGATQVNQENRIKLMLAVARDQMQSAGA